MAWPVHLRWGERRSQFATFNLFPQKDQFSRKHPSSTIYNRKMAFQSQFKTMIRTFPVFIGSFAPDVLILCHVLPAKMCRNGTRENCPVQKCRFQHTTPAHVIYSSAPRGPPPTPVMSPARAHLPSANAQHTHSSVEDAALRDVNGNATAPSGTALDAKALAQGTVVLAACSACLPT